MLGTKLGSSVRVQILLTAESCGDRKECSSELWNRGQDTPTRIDYWRGLEFLKADLEVGREVTLLCFVSCRNIFPLQKSPTQSSCALLNENYPGVFW